MALVSLLGEDLLGKGGPVKTADALAGKKAVALYFSAHWCPPCRHFTPQFSEWYTKDLKAKGLEVVFVSSDKDEGAFTEYYGEMPWLALPYDQRDLKATLSKKFKVQGIPSVVVLDGSGSVLNKDGRSAIASDPTGASFPWIPKKLKEVLAPLKLIGKDGSKSSFDNLKDKVIGIYFSAHWCPPCRNFTPKLAEWYSKDLKAKGMEIVFVSSDKDDGAFKEYFGEMPWLALDYSQRKEKEELSEYFGIEGIPSFIILDKDGSVVTKDGRGAVSNDPIGAEFPWYSKPVGIIEKDVSIVNETTTVIAFCEAVAKAAVDAAMTPVGKRYQEEAKAAGEDEPEMAFLVGTEAEGVTARIRSMVGLPEAAQATQPQLVILDIPDNGGYYLGPEGPVTTEVVEKLVADYKAKKLERKQLEG